MVVDERPKLSPLRAVRMIGMAETIYAQKHPGLGYTCTLADLVNMLGAFRRQFPRPFRLAISEEADLCSRAAHVEGKHLIEPAFLRNAAREMGAKIGVVFAVLRFDSEAAAIG